MFSSPLVLQIPSSMQITDEQFFEFCQVNRDLRIERNKFGELDNPARVSGDRILPGFILNMSKVW